MRSPILSVDPFWSLLETQCMPPTEPSAWTSWGPPAQGIGAAHPGLLQQCRYWFVNQSILCYLRARPLWASYSQRAYSNLSVQYNNAGCYWDYRGVVARRACSRMHTQAVSRPSWGNDVHLHYSVYAGAPTAPCVCFLKVETLFSCRDETSSTSKYFIVVIFLTVTMNTLNSRF